MGVPFDRDLLFVLDVEETKRMLATNGMMDRLRDEVLTEQVFDFLLQNAQFLGGT